MTVFIPAPNSFKAVLDIPFDIVVNFEGAGRTVTRKLETCFLGANDFAFAHDGKTLLDSYGFIARSFN